MSIKNSIKAANEKIEVDPALLFQRLQRDQHSVVYSVNILTSLLAVLEKLLLSLITMIILQQKIYNKSYCCLW